MRAASSTIRSRWGWIRVAGAPSAGRALLSLHGTGCVTPSCSSGFMKPGGRSSALTESSLHMSGGCVCALGASAPLYLYARSCKCVRVRLHVASVRACVCAYVFASVCACLHALALTESSLHTSGAHACVRERVFSERKRLRLCALAYARARVCV